MNFSGMENLGCISFLLLLFVVHLIEKHSFHLCSCVSSSGYDDIFSFVFLLKDLLDDLHSLGAGVMWWELENNLLSVNTAHTRFLETQGALDLCWELAASVPPQVKSSGPEAWRWAAPAACVPGWLCPPVPVPTNLSHFSVGVNRRKSTYWHLWRWRVTNFSRHLSPWTIPDGWCHLVPFCHCSQVC